jgi:hypothetical protein
MPRTIDDTTSDLIDTLVRGLADRNPYQTDENGRKRCLFCGQREGNEHLCRCSWYIALVLDRR